MAIRNLIPGRAYSLTPCPQMKALAESLASSRGAVAGIGDDAAAARAAIAVLEDMGAQIGRLQVGCCTEKRMPLYARMLRDLTDTQIAVSRAIGQGH